MPRGVDQVGDGLAWDWEPDALELTCWEDQDVLYFVEGSILILIWASFEEEGGGKRIRCPRHWMLKDLDWEYLPKRAVWVQKYYMRRGLYMALNTSVQKFVERQSLNDLKRYLLYFHEDNPKKSDQDEIIEILDQAKAWYPEWYEAMDNANTDIFEVSYEESVLYFKCLEKLGKIRRTNGPNPSSLSVDDEKSVTNSVSKSPKNHKGPTCGLTIVTTITTTRLIAEQLPIFNSGSIWIQIWTRKQVFAFTLKKSMHSKGSWSLKWLQAVRRGRLNPSSLLKLT
jgi:hypothetical protein